MNSTNIEQIAKLEMLFSEQEHTLQTLNDIITRQDRDIAKLILDFESLKLQYMDLKSQLPDQQTTSEIPPHY
ncbi:MAG: putative coiled-coil protein SlyX [Candidatus Azotimanducaceae bacterium]|jgi:uncharacterized coiled-coil protein SlyX